MSKFNKIAILAAGGLMVSLAYTAASDDNANALFSSPVHAAEKAVIIPEPKLKIAEKSDRAVAIFAGGCFWGVEGVFSHARGVISAESGYVNGKRENADYRLVSNGYTKHAEAVRIVYNPQKITYAKLMQIFFSVVADPTTLNYQGPDYGKHYRTALAPTSAAQQKMGAAYIKQLNAGKFWSRPIVTTIERNKGFFPAETYHQDFMFKNPRNGYILRWDAPKVENLKKHFPALYRAKPVG